MNRYGENESDVKRETPLRDVGKLATRIGKLLRQQLGTDQPGEILAAAAALKRTLSAAGLDFHDLTAAIEAGLAAPTLVPIPLDDDGEDWKTIARYCHQHRDELSEKEADFISNLLRYERPTTKQFRWLVDIRARLIDEGGESDDA
jgi:hypothetical protein